MHRHKYDSGIYDLPSPWHLCSNHGILLNIHATNNIRLRRILQYSSSIKRRNINIALIVILNLTSNNILREVGI